MKILLASDGSDSSKRAARYLAAHVAGLAAKPEVHVLNVHPSIPYPKAAAVVGKAALQRYYREECEAALAVAEKPLRKAGIAFKSSWRTGAVVEEIGAFAKKKGIDLIVMGSHGRGMIANLAMGSVTTKVIASLQTPVLVVP